MSLSENALYLLENRYCLKGEKPDDVLKRVSKFLGSSTKEQRKIYNLMRNGIFFPNSPCLFNAGLQNGNLHACYTLPITDDIEGILGTLGNMVRIFKSGGGVGINFTPLRPSGAPLSGRGESSGMLSFMEVFDVMADKIKQGGVRRGALMGISKYTHPDILEFIEIKRSKKLENFNLSVLVDDDFMSRLDNGYSDIFDMICMNAWRHGEPGLLFYDRINKDNPFPEEPIDTCNPCFRGDTYVTTKYGLFKIKDLVGKSVEVFDGNDWIYVDNFRITGTDEQLLRVDFLDGSYIDVTPNHQLYLEDGTPIKAMDLIEGDSLECIGDSGALLDGKIKTKGAYLKGFLVAEGFISGEQVVLKVYEPKYQCVGRLIESGNTINPESNYNGNTVQTIDATQGENFKTVRGLTARKKELLQWASTAKEGLPEEIFQWSLEDKCDFIAGIFDGDGTHFDTKNGFAYQFSSSSFQLTQDILLLLKTIGVYGRIGIMHSEGSTTIHGKTYPQKINYRITISQKNSIRLSRLVSFTRLPSFENKKCSYQVKFKYNEIVGISPLPGRHTVYCCTVRTTHKLLISNMIISGQCSEVAMPHYSACCLGSINISKFVFEDQFDFDAFGEHVITAGKILSTMNMKSHYPAPIIKEKMERYNPVGVGIMGFADTLIMLGIKYDSQDCLDFIDRLGEVYKRASEEDEAFHFYRRIIAPTGSLSILADCSSGIEPVYDATFKRNLTVGVVSETRELYKSKFLRTSYQVSPEWHVKVLSKWQEWVDGGVSKTVNLQKEATIQDVRGVYISAWKSGCKGITVYRDKSRQDQVLSSSFKPNKCDGESCTL